MDLRERLVRQEREMHAEMDLREKLLRQEVENLEATLNNLQSLGVTIDGAIWDALKNTAKKAVDKANKMVTGSKTIDEVFKALSKKYTGLSVHDGMIEFNANGKDVKISPNGSQWHLTIDGATFEIKNMKDLMTQIDVRTRSSVGEVMRHSRTILLSRWARGSDVQRQRF